ncbi:MAG: hypothetical protein ACRET0_08540, partial [Steroidobacteraceae bacterium]
MLFAALLPGFASAPLGAATRQKTQAELHSLRQRIAAMALQDSRDARERGRLTAQLRAAELSLSRSRNLLADTEREYADHAARRAQLAAQRAGQVRS